MVRYLHGYPQDPRLLTLQMVQEVLKDLADRMIRSDPARPEVLLVRQVRTVPRRP